MLCKCHWIVLYTVHFTTFCLRGPFFHGHGVVRLKMTSKGRVCLGLADVKRYGVPYFGRSDAKSASTK